MDKELDDLKVKEMICDIKSLGFSEEWIAKQVKLSRECINRLKTGIVQNPRIKTYYKIVQLHNRCFPVDH